jgi:hypothetical protein
MFCKAFLSDMKVKIKAKAGVKPTIGLAKTAEILTQLRRIISISSHLSIKECARWI